ncbi:MULTISPECIES: hypothetical protein [unclassified Cupriavidus]|uniref:hypothetical protein n=1 Tax=unclassified Cupriavidus TaxID=2640874 RepID=UPI001AE82C7F|nr:MULTISPECIES: hypothetical protein [unclassified Cupriavidus]MBP0633191.1 hypothetical protein [Cupriavidus sp. AcVe19-1a]MBP0640171.1 hypothetical protein [Cupriavidus sp. AcVe19-6a]
MPTKKIKVELADLAAALNLSSARLERELALLGWGMIINEANRLAHASFIKKSTGRRVTSRTTWRG